MELNRSILVQKQVKDNSEDLQSEFLDLKNWEEQMKRKEKVLLNERDKQQLLPAIRSKIKKQCVTKENKMTERSKGIKSYDYTEWDKLDVKKGLDEDDQSDDSEEALHKMELKKNYNTAMKYKQQGNDFVQQKKWNKAIASYSEAIKHFPYDATFYANRALCYLKQDNLYSAEADCTSAIQIDENYVKAYHRRATARMALKQYREAKYDVEKVLTLEPSNKEAKILLSQVNKHLENLEPIIIPTVFECREDTVKDSPIEKKIGEKMFGNVKSNKKVVEPIIIPTVFERREDTVKDSPIEKKIGEKMFGNVKSNKKMIKTKKNKNKENDLNEVAAKPAAINVTKQDTCIPDWLPEKDNVAIVEPIEKLPHLRSKEPFKKIPVQEADLTKSFKEEPKASCSKSRSAELSNKQSDITKHKEIVTKPEPEENITESCIELSIPKTACQFILNWRKYTSSNLRYKYIKQIDSSSPNGLSKIFQDSMESNIFSDILTILKTEFMKRKEPIFSYLRDLSNIKRFRAFVMFLSNSEKEDLKLMFSYCKMLEKIPEEEVAELRNKYEVE